MKIATWNIERLKHKNELDLIIENCEKVGADIFVLTETDSRVNLKYYSIVSTAPPKDMENYKQTEARVTIYTNYEIVRRIDTFDDQTAVCVELVTEAGNLLVYGTVIGIYGNRHKNFLYDLQRQVDDIERLAKEGSLCVIGDFNCSFTDNYYFTKDGRKALEDVFSKNDMTIVTREQQECIDHIAVSNEFIAGGVNRVHEWNHDKRLSDHKGIAVELR